MSLQGRFFRRGEDFLPLRRELRAAGKKLVLTNGAFDVLHVGHVRCLQAARAQGDVLAVALNSDESLRRLKGPGHPVQPEEERAEILLALGAVDYVVLFGETRAAAAIRLLAPEVQAKGTDYTPENYPEREALAEVGARLAITGDPKDHSSTVLVERLRRAWAARARRAPAPGWAIVIPARFGATRLPGKPLLAETGWPLIRHVWQRARAAGADRVLIATDDERIRAAARDFGAEAALTSLAHPSGTDRVAEAARDLPEGVVVNLQGDEPEIEPAALRRVALLLRERPEADLATLAVADSAAAAANPAAVKVVRDARGFALLFSRAPLPWWREAQGPGACLRHLGLYAYRREALLRLAQLPPSDLEQAEKLEQLRALAHGLAIAVEVVERAWSGIDTPADYRAFVERWRAARAAGQEEEP